MSNLIEIARKIISSRFFNSLIFSLILLSAVIIGLETYPTFSKKYYDVLSILDKLIIALFTIEIALKIFSYGKKPWVYFSDPWNVFDFIIVAICLIPSNDTHYFAVFRILRILRVLRMITVVPKLKLIISALLKSIPSMGYIIMLIGILFYVYAIVGVFLFGATDPMHFGDLHHTFVTLFKVLTLEGWTDIMNVHIFGKFVTENMQIISIWPFFYFSSFILIGAMIIMNLFIGVIMNSMEESKKELSQELNEKKHKDKDTDELYKHIITRLDDLNNEIKSLKMKSEIEKSDR
jgi:voltage-gated sodium channel